MKCFLWQIPFYSGPLVNLLYLNVMHLVFVSLHRKHVGLFQFVGCYCWSAGQKQPVWSLQMERYVCLLAYMAEK